MKNETLAQATTTIRQHLAVVVHAQDDYTRLKYAALIAYQLDKLDGRTVESTPSPNRLVSFFIRHFRRILNLNR